MGWRGVSAAVCLAASAGLGAPVSAQDPARFDLRVRDSRTGASVAARVLGPEGPGPQARLRIEAEGYRPMETRLEAVPGTVLPVTVWLDPLEPPAFPATPEIRAGWARIEGRAFDARSGRALAGVRLSTSAAQVAAVSDAEGAFVLDLPGAASARDDPAGLPPTDDLVAAAEGYKTQVRRGLFLVEGVTRLVLDLEPGAGTQEAGERHKMLRSPEELRAAQAEPPPPAAPAARDGAHVSVPASIRVGTSCTCATCSAVEVFTLDTYTRLGLDDEWIASWRADSLRAGAIAFRSYGAYHVAHPRNANYDICSTTCCQVIDPADSHANSDAATAFTSGMMVVNAARTEPFFAEYAAENNGSFCPDGQTGRPASGWACLADGVDAGTTFNGHGRGMCQWGTQRWAANQGRDFLWIVNHYYNDNGHPAGARTGVLQTPGAAYFALAPCRAVDTRAGGTPLPPNGRRTFALGGTCQVPADARAVAAVLTAVAPGASGNLRLYGTGQPPPAASALNFAAGVTRANSAIVALGTAGRIDVQCDMPPGAAGGTHVVLDVLGYFR